MVKPDIFSIFFDDPYRVYQPGQCVTGRVDLQLSKEMKTKGVYLTLFGGADTHWTEQESHTYHNHSTNRTESRSVTVHYRGSEVYINVSVLLWGNGNAQMMPAGRYSLPYSICLPHHCLPSFQGSNGKIQYYCRAKIDRPWRFDHKAKEMFTVLPVYDLNRNPTNALGMSVEDSKSLGCCCCADGTVFFQDLIGFNNNNMAQQSLEEDSGIDTPKTGFVPGENIKATVHIDNRSSRPLQSVEITLLQIIHYTASRQGGGYTHRRNETRKLCTTAETLEGMLVPSKYAVAKDIPIPPVVATIDTNSIIQVQYLLECKLVPTGLSTSRKIQLPITVGTVPLILLPTAPPLNYENTSSFDSPPEFSSVVPAPVEPPPPSYEECMFGKVDAHDDEDNEHTGGNFAFAPRYPVYHI